MKYKYKSLTKKERDSLPSTYGAKPYPVKTREYKSYDLDFESVTDELDVALQIGLESYGDGKASWVICEILKASNNMNKQARMWQLYITEVCGSYDNKEINKAWNNYTKDQQDFINKKMDEYLEYCLEYLQYNFK